MTLVIDSWAWVELFRKGPRAGQVALEMKKRTDVLVSAVSVFEVGRRMQRDYGKQSCMDSARVMLQKARVVPVTVEETYTAFHLIQEHKLHATDALIYATAVNHDCKLLTGDPHFKGKLGVIYVGD